MKSAFLLLVCIGLLCSCHQMIWQNKPINNQIRGYILQTCKKNRTCEIRLKDATDFSWDKLYVFNEAVEDDEISKTLGIEYSSVSPYYSRKWFFLKDNQIVRKEDRFLPEVDKPVDTGDVLITEDDTKEKFSIFGQDSKCEVDKKSLTGEEYFYYLRCVNCR